jgi:hypothetical protein
VENNTAEYRKRRWQKERRNRKTRGTDPMCFPPPAFLFHEPSIDCITINATESGSTQDAPLKATAN